MASSSSRPACPAPSLNGGNRQVRQGRPLAALHPFCAALVGTTRWALPATYLGISSPSKSIPQALRPSQRDPSAHAVAHFRFLTSGPLVPATCRAFSKASDVGSFILAGENQTDGRQKSSLYHLGRWRCSNFAL